MLQDGYHDVPEGKVASVATELEMRKPAPLRNHPAPQGVTLRRVPSPDLDWYRALFVHVGGNWLWFSRLRAPDDLLLDVLRDPLTEVHAVEKGGQAQGLLELNFRTPGECELALFGLGPALVGTGAGAWLMDNAISMAWSKPIERFHVHTCTLDHPNALGFYIRSGFTPNRRMIEIADDPRLTGELPEDAAPHAPLIKGASARGL